jgi:hypothetical protein
MKVLVIGAGRMGAIRVEDLVADKRVTQVLIANRNAEKGKELGFLGSVILSKLSSSLYFEFCPESNLKNLRHSFFLNDLNGVLLG